MEKPLVSFVSFNRCGTAAINLKALLDNTKDDFDLSIVDNGSTDGIWEYIDSINDERIKFKKHFDKNYGGTYASNYSLSKRKKYQGFINIDNDVWIKDPHWIKKLQDTSIAFPDLGYIGAPSKGYIDQYFKSTTPFIANNMSCYYSKVGIIGCCTYTTPEALELLGYRNEECCAGDRELTARLHLFTKYKVGIVGEPLIEFRFYVNCNDCVIQDSCKFVKGGIAGYCCTTNYTNMYKNGKFIPVSTKNLYKLIDDIKLGKTSLFSASIHDEESRQKYPYDYEAAKKNFDFYSNSSNE